MNRTLAIWLCLYNYRWRVGYFILLTLTFLVDRLLKDFKATTVLLLVGLCWWIWKRARRKPSHSRKDWWKIPNDAAFKN